MKSKKKEEIYNVRDYVILPQEGVGKNVELVCNRGDIDQPTIEIIKKFRKAGFQIPIPVNVPVELGVLMGKALDELIHATSGWSFLDLFTKSKYEAPQRAINAVYGVKLLGLFKWLHNGQCCSLLTSQCVTTYDRSYCQTNSNGECIVLSDPCRRKEARGVK